MDTPTLTRILSRTPETRLRLLELAKELNGPAWELNKEQQLELDAAVDQASEHIAATQRLRRAMQGIMARPSA